MVTEEMFHLTIKIGQLLSNGSIIFVKEQDDFFYRKYSQEWDPRQKFRRFTVFNDLKHLIRTEM